MEQENKTIDIASLEKIIRDQAILLEKQSSQIKKLETKCKGLDEVVYQLIGGLFNQRTQSDTIDMHLNHLFGRPNDNQKHIDSDVIWPTTRQGDECMRRITELEEKIKKLEENTN